METRPFGRLGAVSELSLGGGGLGQLWGATTRDECVATVREAVDHGITLLDMAPTYGNGEAENVIGEAFEGRLPDGVAVTTKCRLGSTSSSDVYDHFECSLTESLARMRLDHVDIFFLHNGVIDDTSIDERSTPRGVVENAVIPAFERLMASGMIRAWGLTGIGVPDVLVAMLASGLRPAAIQVIANLLDSPGGLKRFEGPAKPRQIMAAASKAGVAVMGIRAVQAGALTDGLDRPLPADHPEALDYQRAAPFRALALEAGYSPASLAHRYALSMLGPATIVLGVKNRDELRECVAAAEAGPLHRDLIERIDAVVAV